ncbi:MAG: hypothetical protein EOO51_03990 [Flavobacterium sp.]|nr:MAG: hypothetical protein EOO51_03990 [Flavobacterium sp.]
MKSTTLLAILALTAVSCSINGLTNDYGKLNEEERKLIVPLTDFNNLDSSLIYTLNGSQLRAELQKHPKALVYGFTNGCTSEYCRPLIVYENYAKEKGYRLFLVMNGFGNLSKTLEQPHNGQLFAIDGDYYKTSYRSTYIRYFENEVVGKPQKQKGLNGSLLFLENGRLVKALNDLPEFATTSIVR